jgi:hypothetical protein
VKPMYKAESDLTGALTFREKTGVVAYQMATEEPTITEFIVSLDQFDAVALSQAQLIRTPSLKVIYSGSS